MYARKLALPQKKSFFLFGPRQVGKSTLIKTQLAKQKFWQVNLLQNDVFLAYAKKPSRFREEAIEKIKFEKIKIIFVDEIQRLPELLNEVQYLMQEYSDCQFILTGSSARKLKRGAANLLGARAIKKELLPLSYEEIGDDFKLEDALRYGTLPPVLKVSNEERDQISEPALKACDEERFEFLTTYVETYIEEEIKAEGIVRNIGSFSAFLDIAAAYNAELLSYSEISRNAQISASTVHSYYEILEDTLIGFRLLPWRKSVSKRLSAHPKFYFFDMGVVNAIKKFLTAGFDNKIKGKLFEQFIILELIKKIKYSNSEAQLFFWRTNHDAEVDLLIEKHGQLKTAIEIKINESISKSDLSGLRSFADDNPGVPKLVVARVPNAYTLGDVKILPWREFLDQVGQYI